ncbi:MAG: SH3 domain-containing protein [Rhodobacteraceae bacterium]|nr:SH3 domain-containing protein [Paracoccaceae bacterium]
MTRILLAWLVTMALAFPGAAQDVSRDVGKVTGFPLPRFVSMKTSIGNARRGPGFAYRIDWVFNHANTPLMVTGEHDLWRRVKDVDGEGGWMHFRLLSGVRTVVFRESGTPIYDQPDIGGLVFAYADKGVFAFLKKCTLDWCRVSGKGYSGWVQKPRVFGVFEDEVID